MDVMADDRDARIAQLEAEFRQREAEVRDAHAEIDTLRQREVSHVGEAESRDAALAEAQEQQAATAEILRVIASSPTDLTSVLDSIIRSAAQLTAADYSTILQAERGVLRVKASLDLETARVGDE
jgi:hypothetical protein